MFLPILKTYQTKQTLTQEDTVAFLAALIDAIRPKDPSDIEEATHAIQALCFTLSQCEEYATLLRNAILS
ncbi:MAG: preprotein translocase subunit TatB, partial [Methylophilus sp.]|nr:preprotein translocase subunit TatB [Methylophilus sp.]